MGYIYVHRSYMILYSSIEELFEQRGSFKGLGLQQREAPLLRLVNGLVHWAEPALGEPPSVDMLELALLKGTQKSLALRG